MSGQWGVGQFVSEIGTREPWEVGNEEVNREIGHAPEVLQSIGVDGGGRVLFTSMLSEAAQFWPLIVGCMLRGAQLSCADATEAEAVRVRMFCDLLDYNAALGITPEIVRGLAALGADLAEVFGAIDVVAARPGAYEALVSAGVPAHRFVLVGPAVGIGTQPGGPAWVEPEEWELGADRDGIVTVTSLKSRVHEFAALRTAVRGTVVDGHGVIPDTPGSTN